MQINIFQREKVDQEWQKKTSMTFPGPHNLSKVPPTFLAVQSCCHCKQKKIVTTPNQHVKKTAGKGFISYSL